MASGICRRDFLKWVGAASAGVLVASCSSPKAAPSASSAGSTGSSASSGTARAGAPAAQASSSQEPIKLSFLIVNIWNEMDQYVKTYQQSHPNVTISQIPSRENEQEKANALIMANNIPDMIGVEQDKAYPIWLSHQKLTPAPADLVKQLNLFDVAKKGASDLKGNLMFIPFDQNVKPLLWFNQKDLTDVGIDPKNFPTDHEGHLEAYQKLVKKDASGNITRFAIYEYQNLWYYDLPWVLGWVQPKGDPGWLPNYIGGVGSDGPFRFNTPEYIQGLTMFQKLFRGATTCASDKEDRIKGITSDYYAGIYQDSTVPWALKAQKSTITPVYVELPAQAGSTGRVECVVHGWGVGSTSKNKDAAWNFLTYLVSDEILTAQWKKYGTLPSRQSTFDSIAKMDQSQFDVPITYFANRLKSTIAFPYGDPTYGQVNSQVLNDMVAKVATAGADPKQIAADSEKKANQILSSSGN